MAKKHIKIENVEPKLKAGVKLTGPYLEAEINTKGLRNIFNVIKSLFGFGTARSQKILAFIFDILHISESANIDLPLDCIKYLESITEKNMELIENKVLLMFASKIISLKDRMDLFFKFAGRAREIFARGIIENRQYQDIVLLRSLRQLFNDKNKAIQYFTTIKTFVTKDEEDKIKLIPNSMELFEKINSRFTPESRKFTFFMMTGGNSSRLQAGMNINYIKRSCSSTKFDLYMIRPDVDNISLLALIEQYDCHELLHVEKTSQLRKLEAKRRVDGRTITDHPLDQIRKILTILMNLIDYLHMTKEGNVTVHLIDKPLFPNLGFQCVLNEDYPEESYALIYSYYSPVDVGLTRFTMELDGRHDLQKRDFINEMLSDIKAFCSESKPIILTKETFTNIEQDALKSLKKYLLSIKKQRLLTRNNSDDLAKVIDVNTRYFSYLDKLFKNKGLDKIDFSLLDHYDSPYIEQMQED